MILEEFNREIYEKNVREDGYLEGIEDGREEKAIENARNALAMNLTAEQAAQITGLPLEQVLELQKELIARPFNGLPTIMARSAPSSRLECRRSLFCQTSLRPPPW